MPSDDHNRTDEPNESDNEDGAEEVDAEAATGGKGAEPEPTDGEEETEPEASEKIGADPGRDVFSSVEPSSESDEADGENAEETLEEGGTAGEEDETKDEAERETGEMVFCRECGERISATAPTCPNCGAPQEGKSGAKKEKDPGIAALASLIVPGAGQLYNGQFVRGAIAFVGVGVVDVILVLVALVLSLILIGPLFLLLIPVVHILVAYDAYDQAGKINRGEVDPDA